MTERKRNPEEILEDMVNKNFKFQIFEILSGIGAGVGTIAVSLGQSAAYAAAPLTLCVALNYFNRRRLDHLTRQQTLLDVSEVQRRLSSEIQGLRGQSLDGSGDAVFANGDQFQSELASLSETVAALEMQMQQGTSSGDASHIQEEVMQLRNHQLDLSQSLEALNQQLRSIPSETGSGSFDGELSALKAQMAQLQSSAVEPVVGGVDLEPLRAELLQMMAPVQHQMTSLEGRMAQPTEGAAMNPEDLQAVHSQMGVLNDKLESVVAQLSAEIAGFQQSVEQTQAQMQDMHQAVQATVAAPVGQPVESVHQEMQAVVGPLHEQLAALEHKLNAMPAFDPSVSQLQSEQMVSLQNQLHSTNGLIEEVASQFTAELSKIPQLVEEQVDHKVSNLQPAAPQDTKKDALSELDAILADINL